MLLFAALPALPAAACVPGIDYEGRSCSSEQPCPNGFVCAGDNKCHRPNEDAAPPPEDAGVDDYDSGYHWDPSRCAEPHHYPTDGWEVRHYTLPMTYVIDEQYCLGVEDVPGTFIARDYGLDGLAAGLVLFASEWTATRTATNGSYGFSVDHDDGLRLYLDGRKIYDHWAGPHADRTATITGHLAARDYKFTADHYNSGGEAKIFVSWAPSCTVVDPTTTGWAIAYYSTDASGVPNLNDCLAAQMINQRTFAMSWTSRGPPLIAGTGLNKDFEIVGKTRRVFGGQTRFLLAHTDTMRLYVDGSTSLYARAGPGPMTTATVTVDLSGVHDLRFEMVDLSGAGSLSLSW